MAMIDKVRLYVHADGTFDAQYFCREAIGKNETEEEFVERESAKLIAQHPEYGRHTIMDKTRQEIRAEVQKGDPGKRDRKRLRIDSNGKLFMDKTVKTDAEKHDEKKSSAITKLKTIGLTDDEIGGFLK